MDFLDLTVPYADEGEDTVYEHLKAALEYSFGKRGPHGLLLGLAADWNDCLNLKGRGESVFSTLLFYKALAEFIELASRLGRNDDVDKYHNVHGSHQGKPRSIRLGWQVVSQRLS